MSDFLVTKAIKEALRVRFGGAEWACFFEVPCGTGAHAGRSADAVAMNMFPSRGLRVHGVEVKASRGDWMRELKNPAKAEAVQRFCDHWWIAAAPDVVKPDELPPTWGLLELQGKALRQKVAAPLLEAESMTRPFVASLLRCAAGRAARELREQVAVATKAARDAVQDRVAQEVQREVADRTRSTARLEKIVAEFEEASGISITGGLWPHGAAVGAAVRAVLASGAATSYGRVRSLVENARKFADEGARILADIPLPEEPAA